MQDTANHRAVVLSPYSVLSYGVTEMYSMGIPLFVPSVELSVKLRMVTDRTQTGAQYCKKSPLKVPPQHPSSNHPFSPEDRSPEAEGFIAQSPYVVDIFESLRPCTHAHVHAHAQADFIAIHEGMLIEGARRADQLLTTWRQIETEIRRASPTVLATSTGVATDPVPSYEEAIMKMWGVDTPFLV